MHTEATTPQQTRISFLTPLDLSDALEQVAERGLRDTGGLTEHEHAELLALDRLAGEFTGRALRFAEGLWERGVRDMEGVGFDDSCTVEPALLVKIA